MCVCTLQANKQASKEAFQHRLIAPHFQTRSLWEIHCWTTLPSYANSFDWLVGIPFLILVPLRPDELSFIDVIVIVIGGG